MLATQVIDMHVLVFHGYCFERTRFAEWYTSFESKHGYGRARQVSTFNTDVRNPYTHYMTTATDNRHAGQIPLDIDGMEECMCLEKRAEEVQRP